MNFNLSVFVHILIYMKYNKMKNFRVSVRSKNTTCKPLRELTFPVKVIYRMGSQTPTSAITKQTNVIEINTPKACELSGNKILMKQRFTRSNIPTAPWFVVSPNDVNHQKVQHFLDKWKTIIIKHKHSSKGNGIYLITSLEDYLNILPVLQYPITSYIFERYYTYSKEYRIHVNKNGCFYATRKMLTYDAEVRWHRHASNTVWVLEDNELFNKPNNWEDIVTSCVNALKSLELDVAAFDVKVQTKENPKYIILESNSAPALGVHAISIYKQMITNYIYEKSV